MNEAKGDGAKSGDNSAYRACAGIVLIDRAGMVFAGQRIDNPGDAWQMPQGGIDAGETPRDAALRELQEETGIHPSLVEAIDRVEDWVTYDFPEEIRANIMKGRFCGQRQRWYLYRFLGADAQIDIATDHPEFSRWSWMRADDLIEKIVPFKRQVYQTVFDKFRPYLA